MGFFKRITSLFSSSSPEREDYFYRFAVQCSRCGEIIQGRLDTRNDLSIDYGDEGDGETTYFSREILVGDQLCFQRIEVELRFDSKRSLIDRKIQGGKFVDAVEASEE